MDEALENLAPDFCWGDFHLHLMFWRGLWRQVGRRGPSAPLDEVSSRLISVTKTRMWLTCVFQHRGGKLQSISIHIPMLIPTVHRHSNDPPSPCRPSNSSLFDLIEFIHSPTTPSRLHKFNRMYKFTRLYPKPRNGSELSTTCKPFLEDIWNLKRL